MKALRSVLALRRIAALALCAVVCPAGEAPQPTQIATLIGTVKDVQGKALSGIIVTLKSSSLSTKSETHTDSNGLYRFSAVAPGEYVVRAETQKPGGSPTSASLTAAVKAGETTTVDLVLDPASHKVAQYYDEPTFTVAGVSENSGAGVHGSSATMRNTDALAKQTASLSAQPVPSTNAGLSSSPTQLQNAVELRQLIATDDRAGLHNQLAHVEENEGQSLEALKEFQRAAEMDPSESNFFDWGTELLVHRAAEPASEVFTKGARLFPRSVRMLTALAVAEYARGSYESAVDRLCEASDLDPKNRIPYTFLGNMQNAEIKRSPKALAKLARYAELFPNDTHANLFYAEALWNQPGALTNQTVVGQVERLAREAIGADPNSAPAYLQLGTVQATQNQFSEAASNLEKAIALDPALAEAHYRLGQVYRRLGNETKAHLELEIYERLSRSADEQAQLERKAIQQFVYELGTAVSKPDNPH